MKQLTLKDKRKIVAMLSKYYTIHPAAIAIINVAADNVGQAMDLTIKAFSTIGEPKSGITPNSEKPTADNCSVAIAKIDEMSNRLSLIRAIKNATDWSLKESTTFADDIVYTSRIAKKYGCPSFTFIPFKVGPGERITVKEWERIAEYNDDPKFKWHYEKKGE